MLDSPSEKGQAVPPSVLALAGTPAPQDINRATLLNYNLALQSPSKESWAPQAQQLKRG